MENPMHQKERGRYLRFEILVRPARLALHFFKCMLRRLLYFQPCRPISPAVAWEAGASALLRPSLAILGLIWLKSLKCPITRRQDSRFGLSRHLGFFLRRVDLSLRSRFQTPDPPHKCYFCHDIRIEQHRAARTRASEERTRRAASYIVRARRTAQENGTLH